MKLRLRENSIRLRLLRAEMARLREGGTVSETIRFNQSQTLTYTLKISNEIKEISVCFEDKKIIVEIPTKLARDWSETNLVGLEHEQKIDKNLTLKILLEKDFVCTERPFDRDNADAFPHRDK